MESVSVQRFKRRLTMQLVLERGAFWSGVYRLRKKWLVTPIIDVPNLAEAAANESANRHFRDQLKPDTKGKRGIPPTPEPARGPFDSRFPVPFPTDVSKYDVPQWKHWKRDWAGDIQGLYWGHIPDRFKPPGNDPHGWAVWEEFLQFCVLYHPPDDRLLEFADCGGPYFDEWAATAALREKVMSGQSITSTNPIVFLHDRMDEWLAVAGAYEALLRRISERYLEPHGLTLDIVRSEIGREGFSLFDHQQAYLATSPPKPYIAVEPYTTQEQVISAFRDIRASQPEHVKPRKPTRDELTALQCAILHDKLGWTHRQIAEHFDWPLYPDEHGTPRLSPKVRDHISDGRLLIAGQNQK